MCEKEMSKNYYFVTCHSANDFCVCKDREDYIHLNNKMGISAFKKDTLLYGGSLMSNHYHIIIRSQDVVSFIKSVNGSYSKYFNKKYGFRGHLWLKRSGIDEIPYYNNSLLKDKLLYSIGNSSRHNVCYSTVMYPWNTSRVYFNEPKVENNEIFSLSQRKKVKLLNAIDQKKFLPRRLVLPESYRMSEDGLLLPESFIDKSLVRRLFNSQSSFYYNLKFPSTTEVRNRSLKADKLKHKLSNSTNPKKREHLQKQIENELHPQLVKQTDEMVCAELFAICEEYQIPLMKPLNSDTRRPIKISEFKIVMREIRNRMKHITQKQCSRCMSVKLELIKKYW